MAPPAPARVESPESLLARWQETGDAAALGALFDATAGDLFRIALAVAPDPAAAEDALQETFLALLESSARFDTDRPVMPLLVGILRHKVERVRRRVVRLPDPRRVEPSLPVEGPAAAAERGEDAERVRAAILALPETYRKAALLRWRHGLEPAEIAEILETPPGTVWSLLSRARERLARVLTGSTLAVAAGVPASRGIGSVREAVIRRALARGAAISGAAAAAAAGGVLVAKKSAAAVAAIALLLLAGGGAWVAWGPEEPVPGEQTEPVSTAARPAGPAAPAKGAASVAVDSAATSAAASPGPPPLAAPLQAVPEGLPPEYAGLTGRIFDGDRKPVAGARVRIPFPDGQVAETRADEAGEFRLVPPRIRWRGALRTNLVAEDGRGRIGLRRISIGFPDTPDERSWVIPSMGMGDIVLRPRAVLSVRVSAGGKPVEGALVQAALEGDWQTFADEVRTDADGNATLATIHEGRWTVFARAEGFGRGMARTALPRVEAGPLVVALTSRVVEVEVVEKGSGRPVEGIRLFIREETTEERREERPFPDPPLRAAPTDSSGRTRIEGVAIAERLEVLPIPPGERIPDSGTVATPIPEGATALRIEMAGRRAVRWPLTAGGRPVPPDGSAIRIASVNSFRYLGLGIGAEYEGTVHAGVLEAEGFGHRELNLLAMAPDGSLARLRAGAGADQGAPASFSDACSIEVVVRDEDGKPVTDALVTVKDDAGEPLNSMEPPDAEGRTVVGGLPAGTVVICALSHWDYGGAEVARVDLSEGATKREVVVGRAFPVVLRFRVGGKARLPEEFEIRLKYPGPGPLDGLLCQERPVSPTEDPARGEFRFSLRPHAPGKSVAIEVDVPGRDDLRREVAPPPPGGEAVVEFDL